MMLVYGIAEMIRLFLYFAACSNAHAIDDKVFTRAQPFQRKTHHYIADHFTRFDDGLNLTEIAISRLSIDIRWRSLP